VPDCSGVNQVVAHFPKKLNYLSIVPMNAYVEGRQNRNFSDPAHLYG
jgi:hypothetical protein